MLNSVFDMPQAKKNLNKVGILSAINVFVLFMSCGLYSRLHFSIDGYFVGLRGHQYDMHFRNGRPGAALTDWLISKIGLNFLQHSGWYVGVFIVICGLLTTALVCYIAHCCSPLAHTFYLLVDVGVLLTFANGFINDWYGFAECIPWYAVTLIGVCSAAMLTTEKGKVWLAALLLIIGYNCYQIGLIIYVFYVMCFIWLKNDGQINKRSMLQTLTALGLAVFTVVSNLVVIKILLPLLGIDVESGRYSGLTLSHILDNAKTILRQLPHTWIDANNQLPKWLLPAAALVLLAIALAGVLTEKERPLRERAMRAVSLLIILAAGIAALYSVHLISDVVWLTSRTLAPLFCLFGILAAVIAASCKHQWLCKAAAAVISVFFLFNVYSLQNGAQEVFASTAVQQTICLQIQAQIDKYEADTGITVDSVAFFSDSGPTWFFPFATQADKEQAQNAFTVPWNSLSALNYYTGRQYRQAPPMDADLQAELSARNWNAFVPDEQLVFIDNALYVVAY